MRTRKSNGEGSCRKIASGKYECVIQSNLINSKTLNPKRFMRRAATEKEARALIPVETDISSRESILSLIAEGQKYGEIAMLTRWQSVVMRNV